jgi:hypothetical protein
MNLYKYHNNPTQLHNNDKLGYVIDYATALDSFYDAELMQSLTNDIMQYVAIISKDNVYVVANTLFIALLLPYIVDMVADNMPDNNGNDLGTCIKTGKDCYIPIRNHLKPIGRVNCNLRTGVVHISSPNHNYTYNVPNTNMAIQTRRDLMDIANDIAEDIVS